MNLLLFYAFCTIGWFAFAKMKIPTPAILGPLVAVCAANIFGLPVAPPSWLKTVLSLAMGAMLGFRFNINLKGVWVQVLLAAVWIMGLSILTAKALELTGVDKSTALFSAMPGGIAEISLMAIGYDANGFAVALLQTSRLLLTMLLIPLLVRKMPKPNGVTVRKDEAQTTHKPRWIDWIILLGVAGAAAYVLSLLHIPAAAMVGPMLAVGLFTKVRGIGVKLDKKLQTFVQLGVGGLIGIGITLESLSHVGDYILPMLLLCTLIVGGSLLLALVLHKTTGWDKTTCLLAASPAGLSPMILLAIEWEADSVKVIVFQVLRLSLVLVFAPICASLLLK